MIGLPDVRKIPVVVALSLAVAATAPILATFGLKEAVLRSDGVLPELETSVRIVDRDGVLLRPFPISDGRWRLAVEPHQVDETYVRMLLAFEDKRFYDHRGVDVLAFMRAFGQVFTNGRAVSGGSTLTMQVARLLSGRNTKAADRKIGQILRALALEGNNDKQAILKVYLNHAPFGGNLEGVRTASHAYFGKEPIRLSAAEAALLVALPQAPESRRPDRFAERAQKARDRVLARARAVGILDEHAYSQAIATPVPTRRRDMPVFAAHMAERARATYPDKKEVRLRINARIQRRLEALARDKAKTGQKAHSVAILVADIETGDVLASVGSPDYFNRKQNGFVDMTQAVRSPGSTLKPLIYALAFAHGIAHPESLIDDRPVAFSGYAPANFDRDYQGTVTVRDALQLSLNVPAVQLLDALGPSKLVLAMRKIGVEPVLPKNSPPNLAIGLGGVGVTLKDLVAMYATLASNGYRVPLRTGLDTFRDRAEEAEAIAERNDRSSNRRKLVLNPRAAWMTASIMAGTRDPNRVTGGSGGTRRNFAFKTGTTYGYRDAWAIGFDGRHVVGVWTGRPDGKPVPGLVGIDIAAPILADAFARLGPSTPLLPPPPGVSRRQTASLPAHLKHIGRAAAERAVLTGGPELAYPPDRAKIDLRLSENDPSNSPLLHLKVRNGKLPFTYLVNGSPISKRSYSRRAEWRPDTQGFVDIVVIDARGEAASAQVFLQ